MNINEILSKCDHTLLDRCATWADIKTILDDAMHFGCASACIPPSFVKQAKDYVKGNLKICTVIGFPNGYNTTAGKVYETPYGSLLPEKVRGVLACGRCMSADGDAWESFRVIPAAAMTGEAAGTAAALAVEKNCDSSELAPETVRAELRKNNFKFFFEEVGLAK